MDTQTTPSGVPYLAYLSGLNLGQGGMSGAMDPSLAGGGAQAGAQPGGMTGGLSLSELQQLLMQQQGDTGAGAPGVSTGQLLQGIGGTVGQGTLGAGIASPTQGGGTGGYTAGQSTAGGIDPLAIIKQALGLGAKAAGALGSQSGTPGGTSGGYTAGDTSGTQQGQISPTGYSLTGAGAPAAGSPEGLSQYFGGQFAGTNLLQDPTLGPLLTQGLLEGSVTPSDLANFATLGGDQLAGLRTALATGNVQSDLGSQLLSGTGGTGGYTLGGSTNLDLSGATGGATGGYGLGNVASGLGGLQGLLGLVQGAQTGNPTSILQGLQGAYGGITGALGVSPIADMIASYAPELGSALVSALGTGTSAASGAASAGAAASAPAISAALAGIGGAAAPIIAGIVAYIGAMEEKKARESGYANNPIAGGLYSAATQGVGKDLGLLDQIRQAGGFSQVPTDQLEQMLPQLVNQLGPYFATAQGPKGPIQASDALTGLFGRPGLGGTEQYTANEQQAQQGVMDLVNELMGRGVSYEQLGQLPVSNAFSNLTMDMYNPLQDFYGANAAKYNEAAAPLLQSVAQANQQMLDPQEAMRMAAAGQNPATFGYQQDAQGNWYTSGQYSNLTPDVLFKAAQGAGYFGAPDSATHAGGLTSAMYGGPLWEAMARMNAPGTPLSQLVQQHFNPWAVIGGFNPQDLTASLQPILQSMVAPGDTGAATGTGPGGTAGEGY